MNTTPIEFMAWDNRAKRFVEFDRIYFDNNTASMIAHEHKQAVLKYIDLMQLTALRSINDEPIYNHMIVKDDYGKHYVVDMFNYYQMYNLANYYIKLEIVGNRFQHEELLELCK